MPESFLVLARLCFAPFAELRTASTFHSVNGNGLRELCTLLLDNHLFVWMLFYPRNHRTQNIHLLRRRPVVYLAWSHEARLTSVVACGAEHYIVMAALQTERHP
eukprot:3103457-Amphidinium_carterae.1